MCQPTGGLNSAALRRRRPIARAATRARQASERRGHCVCGAAGLMTRSADQAACCAAARNARPMGKRRRAHNGLAQRARATAARSGHTAEDEEAALAPLCRQARRWLAERLPHIARPRHRPAAGCGWMCLRRQRKQAPELTVPGFSGSGASAGRRRAHFSRRATATAPSTVFNRPQRGRLRARRLTFAGRRRATRRVAAGAATSDPVARGAGVTMCPIIHSWSGAPSSEPG